MNRFENEYDSSHPTIVRKDAEQASRFWLLLDQRPHFEILGSKYKNENPASEEEVRIPIKPKNEKE